MSVRSEWDPKAVEIGQDLPFQRRMWVAQRAGWAGMAAILIVATLGFLGGDGLLAEARASSSDGNVSLHYHRVGRHGRPGQTEIEIARSLASDDGKVTLRVSKEWLGSVNLERLVPEPAEVVDEGDVLSFGIPASPDGTAPVTLVLQYEYDDPWFLTATFEAEGSAVRIDQFVYP